MREHQPERPEMEDMRRIVERYARGEVGSDALVRETRRQAFWITMVLPLRRWIATAWARRGTDVKASPGEARRPASAAERPSSSAG